MGSPLKLALSSLCLSLSVAPAFSEEILLFSLTVNCFQSQNKKFFTSFQKLLEHKIPWNIPHLALIYPEVSLHFWQRGSIVLYLTRWQKFKGKK